MCKIVGIGACVMDTLITVPFFPKEDTKLRALESRPAGGGPVSTGLVTAAKLGIPSAYIGVLANDSDGGFLMEDFKRYGVDTQYVERKDGYRSFTSSIWLNQATGTRTCVFDKGTLPPLLLNESQKQAICRATVLMVDGNELSAAIEAASLARQNRVSVLYDAGGQYPSIELLLALTDILIPSEEFALAHTGASSAEEAAKALMEAYHPRVVVITQGARGSLMFDGNQQKTYPAFATQVVDSNGAGDVFHGAFAAAVAMGYDFDICCRFASAASSLKCQGIGARESAPGLTAVKQLLTQFGYLL